MVSEVISSSPTPAHRCEILCDFGQLEALAGEWDRLWLADGQGEVFQSFSWNRAWWKACGSSLDLCTPVVYVGSKVLGILPLVRRLNAGGSGVRLEFLGSPHADYADVICEEENTVQVLSACFGELQKLGDWQEGFLDGLPEESRIARHFAKLSAEVRTNSQLIASDQCYTIQLGERASEILDGLARKQHLRRRQNKLEKAGKVVFRHLESVDDALAHLELFFRSQRRRRAIHGKSSASESEDFRELLRCLVKEFDLKRDLHFGVLELNEKPIAWHISFEINQKLVFYQQTFEVDAWDFAPGEALLRYLLLFAKGRITREFDFTRGDEPFKARFGNHSRQMYQVWLQRRGLRGRISGMRRRAAGSAKARLGKLRTAAKADKGIFERWRGARRWWLEHLSTSSPKLEPSIEDQQNARSSVASSVSSANQNVAVYVRPDIVRPGAIVSAIPSVLANGPALPSQVCLIPAGLGDLVDFAQQNPQILTPTRVLDLRERFRQGDRAFVQRSGELVLRVGWITQRPLKEVLRIADPPQTPDFLLTQPALTLYELWEGNCSLKALPSEQTDCQGLDPFNQVFEFLQEEAARLDVFLYLSCSRNAKSLSEHAERRGFKKVLELKRGKLAFIKKQD